MISLEYDEIMEIIDKFVEPCSCAYRVSDNYKYFKCEDTKGRILCEGTVGKFDFCDYDHKFFLNAYKYDDKGRMIYHQNFNTHHHDTKSKNPKDFGRIEEFEYNDYGDIIRKSHRKLHQTEFRSVYFTHKYDKYGRVIHTEDSKGTKIDYLYNGKVRLGVIKRLNIDKDLYSYGLVGSTINDVCNKNTYYKLLKGTSGVFLTTNKTGQPRLRVV